MDVVVPPEFQHLFEQNDERPVVKIPAEVLRQQAKPIEKLTKRHKIIAENMVRIMRQANGVGIAAPQIGLSERIIVIAPDTKPIVFVNPVITEQSGTQKSDEGCLSIPGLYGEVERAEKVSVEGYDIKGRAISYDMEGYAATVVQHEIDHLDGVLFIDKADPASLRWEDPEKR